MSEKVSDEKVTFKCVIEELEKERDELKSKIEVLECICPSCDKKAEKIFEIYDGHKVYTLKCDNCGFTWLPSIQEYIIDYRNLKKMREERDRLAEINKVLTEALEKYGRHEKLCAEIGGYGYCSCGLEKAIAKAKEMRK